MVPVTPDSSNPVVVHFDPYLSGGTVVTPPTLTWKEFDPDETLRDFWMRVGTTYSNFTTLHHPDAG